MTNENIKDMSVVDHLSELRKRLIIIIIAIAAATGIIYEKAYYLIKFLMLPLAKFKLELVYFSLAEGFMTRMGISLLAGTIIVSPIILYQLAAFVNPGLSKNEKRLLYKNLFFMAILLLAGITFGYILVLPYALNFLISYGQNYMNPLLSGSTYFNFIGIFCFFTGIVFLIPYIIVLLGKLSLINSKRLRKWRKYIFIATLTLEGLFISNAGLITCILVAAPVLILYEISIWIVYFTEKRLEKKKSKI
ncbi:twin-arginine translocase subunit TatC [Clostridium pasteurianum]|uniref:Sec-independent protein translocase protein TatC n=1 Tax=Clostridium pasteurianum BC1 TaxID=86416 RepID=R4K8K8_CLOPA|nr:twin-arginine translocase subunit TatC [Clostridium pasteurianum]AGK96658.1 twin arginine targeting protein translocase subunit TatC [Clostridium pasteurianum BC1]AGK96879.1 twin arginine targeting protein translocase subunit TatC [Clostridium pasteurianum BC1]